MKIAINSNGLNRKDAIALGGEIVAKCVNGKSYKDKTINVVFPTVCPFCS